MPLYAIICHHIQMKYNTWCKLDDQPRTPQRLHRTGPTTTTTTGSGSRFHSTIVQQKL